MIAAADAARLGVVERFAPGSHARVDAAVQLLHEVGITRIRTHVSWAEYHAEGGRDWYDWLLQRLGGEFELLPCVHDTPPGLSETGRRSGPPRRLRDFADFVDTIIDRHGTLFSAVELWNEPNNLLAWDGRQDVGWHKFAEMIGGAGYLARQCGKLAVLGGPCPTDTNWLRLMGERGVLGVFDVVGVHGFLGTSDSVEVGIWPGWDRALQDAKEAMRPFQPSVALWITETGYATRRHDWVQQAAAFLQAFDAPVERVYWHGLQDLPNALTKRENSKRHRRLDNFGLYDHAGKPKLLGRLLLNGIDEVRDVVTLAPSQFAHALPPAILSARPVVVTGGAGFIGSNLVDRLAREGHDVLVYDALVRPGVERNLHWLRSNHPGRVSFAIADLLDSDALAEVATSASAVFHLAGQVAVTSSLTQPMADFEVNALGTLRLLEGLRRHNPTAPLIFASTNKVYGDLADISLALSDQRYVPKDRSIAANGVSEARPLGFHTPYGCSKGAADQYVLDYARSFGLRAAVLRMSCIYGERQLGTEDQGWVAHFLLRAIAGENITIYGDGRQVRDVLHVGDAVSAYLATWAHIDQVAGRAFNLGGGTDNAISLLQLIDHIADLLGQSPELTFAPWRKGDQRYFVADTRAVRHELGLPTPLGWRDGVMRLAAHFGARSELQVAAQ